MSASPRASPGGDAFNGQLAAIWERHRPTNAMRVALLGDAASLRAAGTTDAEVIERALTAAHQLAGSLGTFGFDEGTRLAREAERMLREPASGDATSLGATVRALYEIIERPPSDSETGAPAATQPEELAQLVALLVCDDATLGDRLTTAATHAHVALEFVGAAHLSDRLSQGPADAVIVDADTRAHERATLLRSVAVRQPTIQLIALTAGDELLDRVALADAGATVCIPRDASPGRIVELALRSRAPQADTVTTILAVDDDPLVLDTLDALLPRADRQLVRTADAEEFWEAFQNGHPDIALVDLNLPGTDGIDLCRAIRSDHRTPRVSVLVLTAETASETVRAAFAAGADDYIAKPFVGPELEARVAAQTERARLLRELTETDHLSGLDNRQRAEQAIDGLIRLASRQGREVAVAMVDLDRFKRINDDYGHAAGDAALRRTAALLRRNLRGEDVVARWGGEEFLIGMFASSAADAADRVNRLLEIVRKEPMRTARGDEFTVTFSAGIASYPHDGETLDELWRAADTALYRAKERRNCVVSAG